MAWGIYRIKTHDGVAWLPVAYVYAGCPEDAQSNYHDIARQSEGRYPMGPLQVEPCPTRYTRDAYDHSVLAVAPVEGSEGGRVQVEAVIPITKARVVAAGGMNFFAIEMLTDDPQGLLDGYARTMDRKAAEYQNRAWRARRLLGWMKEAEQ